MIFEVLLPYGFLLEYNPRRMLYHAFQSFVTIWFFAGIRHFKLLNPFSEWLTLNADSSYHIMSLLNMTAF